MSAINGAGIARANGHSHAPPFEHRPEARSHAYDTLAIALDLAASGLPVFPCNGQKKPAIGKDRGGNGFRDASTDPDRIRELWKLAGRNAKLIGVPTGAASGFDALDLDYRNGAEAWEVENLPRIPETRAHRTPSGGRHYLFRHVDGTRNSAGKIAPGVDVRGSGGYVCHPPSTGYTVASDADLGDWPDWLLSLVLKVAEPAPTPDPASYATPAAVSEKRHRAFIEREVRRLRDCPDGSRHITRIAAARSIGGIADKAGLSDTEAERILIAARPPQVEEEKERLAIRFGLAEGRKKPINLPDREQFASRRGQDDPHSDTMRFADRGSPPPEPIADPRPEPPPPEEPQGRKRGRPPRNALAMRNALAAHSHWRGAVRWNKFTEIMEVCEPWPPCGQITHMRPLQETFDKIDMMLWLQANDFPNATKNAGFDLMLKLAVENAFHPVLDYFAKLPAWDGVPRLDRLFRDYFNAELPDDPGERDRRVAYLDHVSRCFMVSAVARIHRPGCKVDHLPVLVGPENLGKSRATEALCADPRWFSDDLPLDLGKDAKEQALIAKWIVELAEIPHQRREVEKVKAFLSRCTDRYRVPYERLAADQPRTCVFIGTTNDLELISVTGNRRFWPVEIAAPIDVEVIVRDRDQIWAEALAAFREGDQWWLKPNIEALASDRQEAHEEHDPWQDELAAWIEGRFDPAAPFSMIDAMRGARLMDDASEMKDLDPRMIARAQQCLKRLRWRSKQSRLDGKKQRHWVSVPPRGGTKNV